MPAASPPASHYWLLIDNVSQGPFDVATIQAKLSTGQLTLATPACPLGSQTWSTLALFFSSEAIPATPPFSSDWMGTNTPPSIALPDCHEETDRGRREPLYPDQGPYSGNNEERPSRGVRQWDHDDSAIVQDDNRHRKSVRCDDVETRPASKSNGKVHIVQGAGGVFLGIILLLTPFWQWGIIMIPLGAIFFLYGLRKRNTPPLKLSNVLFGLLAVVGGTICVLVICMGGPLTTKQEMQQKKWVEDHNKYAPFIADKVKPLILRSWRNDPALCNAAIEHITLGLKSDYDATHLTPQYTGIVTAKLGDDQRVNFNLEVITTTSKEVLTWKLTKR